MRLYYFPLLLVLAVAAGILVKLRLHPVVVRRALDTTIVSGPAPTSLDEILLSKAGRELIRHPQLVNSNGFLRDHPDVKSYLDTHPDLRGQISDQAKLASKTSVKFAGAESPAAEGSTNKMTGEAIEKSKSDELAKSEDGELAAFLRDHDDVASELRRNPKLAFDQGYLDRHPALSDFLASHPDLAGKIKTDFHVLASINVPPDYRDSSTNRAGEIAEFLDHHRDIAGDLSSDPSLTSDPDYLADHPGLAQLLQHHGGSIAPVNRVGHEEHPGRGDVDSEELVIVPPDAHRRIRRDREMASGRDHGFDRDVEVDDDGD
jgi:hypothetical protein